MCNLYIFFGPFLEIRLRKIYFSQNQGEGSGPWDSPLTVLNTKVKLYFTPTIFYTGRLYTGKYCLIRKSLWKRTSLWGKLFGSGKKTNILNFILITWQNCYYIRISISENSLIYPFSVKRPNILTPWWGYLSKAPVTHLNSYILYNKHHHYRFLAFGHRAMALMVCNNAWDLMEDLSSKLPWAISKPINWRSFLSLASKTR